MTIDEEIFANELDNLYTALPLPLFASWFNAIFLAWMLIGHIDTPVLVLWIMINTLLTLLRYAGYFYYRRMRDKLSPQKAYLLYFIGLALSSLLWGSSSVFLFPESLLYELLVVFIAGGMVAGALGSVAYRFESYLLYNLSILLPFIVVLILNSSYELHIMGFILILFSGMLVVSSKKFHTNFHNALALQIKQRTLSQSLVIEKEQIAKLNLNLSNEIIEKESAQAKLQKALDEAQQAARAKDAFFATMSHELRTPLNAIIGFSQILLRNKELSVIHTNYIDKILISGNRLLGLVNSILDFSKMRAGKMEPSISSVALNSLFRDLSVLTEPLLQKKSIHFIYPKECNNFIQADPRMLHHILLNLLSNAIKFSPTNGIITLSYAEENGYLFSVCDNGIGIAKEHLETIFDPFTQIKRQEYEQQGTGLGLAIVQEMVQAQNGKIWVESTLGQGSCFYVLIPL
ncbi:MAG: ATP-binding protein [Sulfurimonas sp.]|jgi:signal transduction histidine kinase